LAAAASKLTRALVESRIRGVKTNIPFLLNVLRHPGFLAGTATTRFIEEHPELMEFPLRRNRANRVGALCDPTSCAKYGCAWGMGLGLSVFESNLTSACSCLTTLLTSLSTVSLLWVRFAQCKSSCPAPSHPSLRSVAGATS